MNEKTRPRRGVKGALIAGIVLVVIVLCCGAVWYFGPGGKRSLVLICQARYPDLAAAHCSAWYDDLRSKHGSELDVCYDDGLADLLNPNPLIFACLERSGLGPKSSQ